MRKRITKEVVETLASLVRTNGLIRPEDVLKAARSKKSILHPFFTWDNTAAAEKFRLQQANDLIISVKVKIQPRENSKPVTVRAFTSLGMDRKKGGYRLTTTVLNDEELRAEMLRTALMELEAFRQKYKKLSKLSAVFDAIDQVLSKQKA